MIDTHDTTPCASGCITYRHLADCTDDHCSGCEPRWATDGLLCGRCHNRLATLLSGPNDPESIAGVCAWLADNLDRGTLRTLAAIVDAWPSMSRDDRDVTDLRIISRAADRKGPQDATSATESDEQCGAGTRGPQATERPSESRIRQLATIEDSDE